MKKLLPLLFFLFTGICFNAQATHTMGGEISYKQTSAGNYQVTVKYYRDCNGAQPSTTSTLQVKAPGCNSGRNIPLTLTGRKISHQNGPATPYACSATGLPGVEIITYTGNLTFTAAEATCSDWVLSWEDCCRGSMANIFGQDNLYSETTLKLMAGVVNSSPAFDTLHAPVMVANIGRLHNLSMAAIDPDGDSLVYSLATAMYAANTPVNYQPYPALAPTNPTFPANYIINPNPRPPYGNPFVPQLAQLTGVLPANYNAQFPMPAIYVNWNSAPTIPSPNAPVQPFIWEAKNLFKLNPVNGELIFVPSQYVNGASYASGLNKYVVCILVEEFRKVNGTMTKLGSVRRETLIEVTNTPNSNPEVVARQANNQTIATGQEIRLRPGTPLTLKFTGLESDPNQLIAVNTNATYILPGSTFYAVSGNVMNGTITWTPTAADVRWQPYYFQVMLRDNANPLRGVWLETFAVRVSATGGVTATPEALTAQANFSAYPNPYTEELTFNLNLQTKAESILIYNLLGQKIDEISLKTVGVGAQKVTWPTAGKHAAGTYVARLISADKTVQTLKFTRLQ